MRSLFSFLFIVFVLAVTGCDSSKVAVAPRSNGIEGGIAVGNSMSVYTSELGYSFKYNSKMRLQEEASKRVTVDTQPFEPENTRYSSLEITVLQSPDTFPRLIQNSYDLEQQASEMGAKSSVLTESQAGETLSFEVEDQSYYTGVNLILSKSGLALKVEERISKKGKNGDLVREAKKSIELDLAGPVISEIEVHQTLDDGARYLNIEYVAKDALSQTTLYPVFVFEHTEDAAEWMIAFGVRAEVLDGDRYLVRFKIPELQRSGPYELREVRLSDTSRNLRGYSFEEGKWKTGELVIDEERTTKQVQAFTEKYYTVDLGTHQVSLSRVGEEDVEYPRLLSVELDRNQVKAGEELTIFVEASDDLSGMNPKYISVRLNQWGDYRIEDYPADRVEQKGENLYAVTFKLGKAFWPGDYVVSSVMIGDHFGKLIEYFWSSDDSVSLTRYQTRVVGSRFLHSEEVAYDSDVEGLGDQLTFSVSNSGFVDKNSPRLVAAKVDSSRAEEGFIGIELEVEDESDLLLGGVKLVPLPNDEAVLDDGLIFSFLDLDGTTRHLGGGKYVYEFDISKNLPSGEYRIEFIAFTDSAGNYSSYWLIDSQVLSQTLDSIFEGGKVTHYRRSSHLPRVSTYWADEQFENENGELQIGKDTNIEELIFTVK